MAYFMILAIAVLCIVLLIFLIQIPVLIARGRSLSASDITTITILSWFGLIFGVTWFVALVLSLVWRPGQWTGRCEACGGTKPTVDAAEQLEKLDKLKKRGVITQKEFDAQKKKILG